MLITDSQVHIWGANTPQRPWPARQAPHLPQPFSMNDLLRDMNAAGVTRAVIVPPGWEGERNDLALEAVRKHPDRFAIMGRIDPESPQAPEQLKTWKSQPGMYGIRLTFHTEWQEPLLTEGKLDWLWPVAEKLGIGITLLAPPRLLHLVGAVAQRHPGLKISLDHMALLTKAKDAQAFSGFDQMLALAKFPNIAIKSSCLPSYTTDAYPYRSVHPYLRKAYDAYGPRRMFWGSDLTRLTSTYKQVITLFTEELPWLSPSDKEWIMGRGVCEWMGWPMP